jgi:hypothetical protein
MSESFLSMSTFMSCLCSVLHPTNYVNYKERLIATPAFGSYDFQFCQNIGISSGSPACNLCGRSRSAHINKRLPVLYLPSYFSNTVSFLQHNNTKSFSKLQKQGLLIRSMGFRLAKFDTGHKHMMFSADV